MNVNLSHLLDHQAMRPAAVRVTPYASSPEHVAAMDRVAARAAGVNVPGGTDTVGHSSVQAWSAGELFPFFVYAVERDGKHRRWYVGGPGTKPHTEVLGHGTYEGAERIARMHARVRTERAAERIAEGHPSILEQRRDEQAMRGLAGVEHRLDAREDTGANVTQEDIAIARYGYTVECALWVRYWLVDRFAATPEHIEWKRWVWFIRRIYDRLPNARAFVTAEKARIVVKHGMRTYIEVAHLFGDLGA